MSNFLFCSFHLALDDGVNPIIFAFYREWFGSFMMILLALIAIFQYKHSYFIPEIWWTRLFLMGLFSFGNVVGSVYAIDYLGANPVAMMQPGIPVFTMLLSLIFGMEQISVFKVLGIFSAVGGAFCLVLGSVGGNLKYLVEPKEEGQNHSLLGYFILFGQVLSMASLLVAQKPILKEYHSTLVTFYYYTIGSVLTTFVCICDPKLDGEQWKLSENYLPWLALLYAAIFATFLNYNLYSWTGTVTSPAIISVYSTAQPVGTAILSYLMIPGTHINYLEYIGAVLVVAGLLCTVLAKKWEDTNTKVYKRKHSGQKDSEAIREQLVWNQAHID